MAVRNIPKPAVNKHYVPSAVLADVAILRPLPGGGYVGFERVEDALGHYTGNPDFDAIRRAKN